MRNLGIFSPKIEFVFFKFTLGRKNSNFFLFLFGSKKKSIQAVEKKRGEKMGKKERKTSRNPKVFFIICDIVALPIMT
jgi:hypothetical protein